jgi:hypothetical protein
MQPHNQYHSHLARARALSLTALIVVAAACSSERRPEASSGDASVAVTPAAPSSGSDGSAPTNPSSDATAPADTQAPAEPAVDSNDLTPICETIPPLDVISGIVGAPVDTATDYSDPPVEIEGRLMIADRCEATGLDIGMAIFDRYDTVLGNSLLEGAQQTGSVVPISDPRLPGAVGWANGVMIESDGVYWYATAITPGTVGVADAPEAYAASTALLAAWLGV